MSANPLATLGKLGDLKRRLWFLVGALVVYRIGTFIPVPGIDPHELARLFQQTRGGILDMFNMFSGGALSRFSIFALGIMPYISASIIMQLLTVVSPQLEALKKEGEAGRRKITQYTRYGTVVLSLFQALGISIALESQPGLVIDAEMYGMIPSAKSEKRDSAPPENMLNMSRMPPRVCWKSFASSPGSMPGTGMKVPTR